MVVIEQGVVEVDVGPSGAGARTERLVRHVLDREGRTVDRVSVGFVSSQVIEQLNRKHRGRLGPTDVLSFPFDDSFPQGSGGEVVVCPEQADPPGPKTVDRLVVHGVLHLLGYEDDTDEGLAAMERLTDRILEEFHD